MAHFYETISSKKINYSLEYEKIRRLFENEEIMYYTSYFESISLRDIIEKYYFRGLDISYNYTSVIDFLNDVRNSASNTCDLYVYYVETISSLLHQLVPNISNVSNNRKNILNKIKEINKIIDINLEVMCMTKKQISCKLGNVIVVIPKDEILENALDNISDDDIRAKLIEYKLRKNEGNISEKENILKAIYPFIEGIFKTRFAQQNKRFYEDADFLYNTLNLRHNNEKANDTRFYNETLDKREEWLDLLYREIVLVVALIAENDDHNRINSLKNKVASKKE